PNACSVFGKKDKSAIQKVDLCLPEIHPPPTRWATPFSLLEVGDFFPENLLKSTALSVCLHFQAEPV
ncbi:MAG: hypothetical protein ACE3JN_03145, partial [Ectobacillus sp.]